MAQKKFTNTIQWGVAAELPGYNEAEKHPGVAGAFTGVHNGALIVAGGANFPDKKPWEGGVKAYQRDIYVFQQNNEKNLVVQQASRQSLKQAVAYGASASTPDGIVCAGGETSEGIVKKVFLMQWNADRQAVTTRDLPDLPEPLANAVMANIAHTVYIMGGSDGSAVSSKAFSLDITSANAQWKALPDMPFAMTHAAVAAQSNGEYPCIYVMGGRKANRPGATTLYDHLLRYDPKLKEWKELSAIGVPPASVSAGTAVSSGSNYILLISGDDGKIFKELEEYSARMAAATPAEKDSLNKVRIRILTEHPGFSRAVFVYNTITDTWTRIGDLPFDGQVTATAVRWGDEIFIASGEIRPGVRTPVIVKGSMKNSQMFSWIDSIVLLGCFLLMTLGRYWFTGKTKNTEDYFKGGQRIPKWAAATSIFGAKLSAITFMGIPAKTYATNWTYFFLLMTIVMIMPFVARFFIPFYRRLNVTSAYEYLGKRFNTAARLIASLLYVLLQMGRMSIVVLLPSIALTLVIGIDINLCIILIGIISIFFTVKGGIEAVIWVEVIQVMILATGALLCLVYIPLQLNDWSGGMQALKNAEKLKVFDFRFDFTEPTFWVVIIGGLAINLLTYGTDQTTVQRYLTTKTDKESVKSLQIGAWLTVPSTIVFFSLGTLLYLFFREQPDQVNIALNNQDNVFPWYIASQLPAGLSGLLIAGIFAASMSSTEASMNSTATLLTTDFYKRWKPDVTDRQALYFARAATLALGIFVTCIALYMAHEGVSSLWDKFNTILGLFTGCIGGAFILGIFTRRATGTGVIAGMLVSCVIQVLIQRYTHVHLLMYAFTGLVSCVITGYLFSLLFPAKDREIAGLTVYKG